MSAAVKQAERGFIVFLVVTGAALAVLFWVIVWSSNRDEACKKRCHPYAVVQAVGQCLCADQIRERAGG